MADLHKLRKGSFLRLAAAGILFALCVLLFGLGKLLPGVIDAVYSPFSRWLLSKMAALLSFAPISCAEFIVLLFITVSLISLVLSIVKAVSSGTGANYLLRYASFLFLSLGIAAFLFMAFWGLNYTASPLEDRLGLTVTERGGKALEKTAGWLLEMVNDTSGGADRVGGIVVADGFFGLREDAPGGFEALAYDNSIFEGGVALPKRVTFWPLLSYTGISGVFFPLTGEANVNPDGPDSTLPFTMCHELAHSLGFAQEDDANFVSFLACEQNSNANFRYSGALSAFIYVYNAVAAEDPAQQYNLYMSLNDEVKADLDVLNTYYKKYEGPARDLGETVNDTYLKTMQQTDGVKSYGRVVDLLIAEYVRRYGDPGAV